MKTISTQKSQPRHSFLALLALVALLLVSMVSFGQVTYTDTVCASTQDKVYGITGPNATSSYSWWLSNPAAGTIDNSITANNNQIEIIIVSILA